MDKAADVKTKPRPKQCSRCGSDDLYLINVTGYVDLACGHCGETLVSDVFYQIEYEQQDRSE